MKYPEDNIQKIILPKDNIKLYQATKKVFC